MRAPETRRFTLADGMILIAAIAVAIAWTKADTVWRFDLFGPGMTRLMRFQLLIPLAMPGLAMTGLALGLMRLRNPRPLLRELALQPGAVSTAVIVSCLFIQAVLALAGLAFRLAFRSW